MKENKDNAVLTTHERKCSAVGREVGQKPDLSALTSSLIALSQITDKQIYSGQSSKAIYHFSQYCIVFLHLLLLLKKSAL